MREKQFPDVYTSWEKMKDIKPNDAKYIKQYLENIKNNNAIAAGETLKNLDKKIMYTKDWQEMCDVVDEIINFININEEGQIVYNITEYCVGEIDPNAIIYFNKMSNMPLYPEDRPDIPLEDYYP